MPELPDVEVRRRYLEATSLNRRVVDVSIRQKAPIGETSSRSVRRALDGARLSSSRRHGKWLFVGLDGRDDWLVLHFGMTGGLESYRDPQDEPDHARLVLGLDDGSYLAYDCRRLLGRISLTKDPDDFVASHGLGVDAWDAKHDTLVEALSHRRGYAKSALMDQSVVAGIGNVYADETMHHARLLPRTPLSDLDEDGISRIVAAAKHVLGTAIERGAEPEKMPSTWIVPRRHRGGPCGRCGTKLEKTRFQGRPTWHCPQCVDNA